MGQKFFDEPLKQSQVKTQIVAKYFHVWANIIAGSATKIGYIDLFAGRGYYEDGTESTPILILKKTIENPKISQKLIGEFNDKEVKFIDLLEKRVQQLKKINVLAYPPKFTSIAVSKEIVSQYESRSLPPTFFFLDPWGYKGVSLDLIKVAIKGRASECALFFNYKRINMDLQKASVDKNINDLFGKNRADRLRARTSCMQPYQREETIIQEFCEAINELGGKYTLPFCFRDRKQDRTSHYLIHATKHPLGFRLMKEIMDGYSIKDADGVPTFTFDQKNQLTLNFNQPLRQLAKQLTQEFKGQTLTASNLYEKHQKTARFTKKNYKDALIMLEKEGKIKVDEPPETRPQRYGKVTLGGKRIVSFIQEG